MVNNILGALEVLSANLFVTTNMATFFNLRHPVTTLVAYNIYPHKYIFQERIEPGSVEGYKPLPYVSCAEILNNTI